MSHPHTDQYDSRCRNSAHHQKSHCHGNGNGDHDPDLCFPGHALPFHITLQIVLIHLSYGKSVMQALGTFSQAERSQQKQRNRRQKRKCHSKHTQCHGNASRRNIHHSCNLHIQPLPSFAPPIGILTSHIPGLSDSWSIVCETPAQPCVFDKFPAATAE